jgi:hypothetical protein
LTLGAVFIAWEDKSMFDNAFNLNLTMDGQGYVYWKGIHVEHFSYGREEQKEADAARKVAARCMNLEKIGVPVNSRTAVWFSDWFESMPADHKYKGVLASTPCFYEHAETNRIGWVGKPKKTEENKYILYIWDGKKVSYEEFAGDEVGGYYHPLMALGWKTPQIGQGENCGLCYSSLEQITAFLEKHNFPTG